MPARGEHRCWPAVLPNTDVLQPQQLTRRNFLRHRCNNIAGSASVIEHHRNTGRSP
jgi:hypothetical protein